MNWWWWRRCWCDVGGGSSNGGEGKGGGEGKKREENGGINIQYKNTVFRVLVGNTRAPNSKTPFLLEFGPRLSNFNIKVEQSKMREKILERETLGKKETLAGDFNSSNPRKTSKLIQFNFNEIPVHHFSKSVIVKCVIITLLLPLFFSSLLSSYLVVSRGIPIHPNGYFCSYFQAKSFRFRSKYQSCCKSCGFKWDFVSKSSQKNFRWVKGFVFPYNKYMPARLLRVSLVSALNASVSVRCKFGVIG